jgi:glycerate 2-kinase
MIRVHARLSSDRHLDKLHRDVLTAMDKALEAASPDKIIRNHVKLDHSTLRVDRLNFPLKHYHRIYVIGGGKASGYMAEEIERILGNRITEGLVIIPDYLNPWPEGNRVKYHAGTHPILSKENVRGVAHMLELVENSDSNDLIIIVLSGGASALMDYPMRGITLEDERKTTSVLLESGAKIQEINTVRKHISRVKGGRLAETIRAARILTLIISDVVGDQLDTIGSGPTAPDSTTYRDAKQVLEKYNLWSRIPTRVRRAIAAGIDGTLSDTPKQRNRVFRRVNNVIVGNNRESCRAAVAHMKRAGYNAQILSTRLIGEANDVGRILGSIVTDIHDNGLPFPSPAALVAGGETTVTVKGKGKGGRNQELALAAAISVAGSEGLVVGSLATDGVDGPTDAAGALADGTTIMRGRKHGMEGEEYLENNDSYNYFRGLGDLIKTGPTGTNVNDIMIVAAR